jgi:hypothetical protein
MQDYITVKHYAVNSKMEWSYRGSLVAAVIGHKYYKFCVKILVPPLFRR